MSSRYPFHDRVEAISKCMDDLHYCQEHMNVPDDSPLGNAVGMQIGELDWLSELHRLLHES